MISNKPYLIRAMHEWIVDNHLTPYLDVDANYPGVQVPNEYVTDGRIILNISPDACRGLHLDNDKIVFSASFGGQAVQIALPPQAVQAVYARENGRGMVFNGEEYDDDDDQPPSPPSATTLKTSDTGAKAPVKKGRPNLKVIK